MKELTKNIFCNLRTKSSLCAYLFWGGGAILDIIY